MMKFDKIILASQSPRRRQILSWAEIPFEVIAEPVDETFPQGMPPQLAAQHISMLKANAVVQAIPQKYPHQKGMPILAADTIVVLEGRIMGKPADRNTAVDMLGLLSGKTHSVVTGVVIINEGRTHSFFDETRVTFHPLSDEQIHYYVDHYQPYDKAGSYAIQEWIGVTGISSIQGDFYNVMGLPISRVMQLLEKL